MNFVYFIVFIFVGLILGIISTTGIKSQFVRLMDVFFLGPIMIIGGGLLLFQNPPNLGLIFVSIVLIVLGASTISYNLKNYFYQNQI